MMHQAQMLFLVTGKCNMACPHCAQGTWRRAYINYHMTPGEVGMICRRIKESGLHFDQALIMGGEPTLWKYLEDGCRIIRESKVFNEIDIYSNCKNADVLMGVLDKGLADKIKVQTVNMDVEGVHKLHQCHAQYMDVSQQEGHRVHPESPMEGVLPATCGCDQITVFDGKVWSCPGAYHNTIRMGWSVDKPKVWMDVEEDWYGYFNRMDRYSIPACSVCLANGKVWDRTEIGSRAEDLR